VRTALAILMRLTGAAALICGTPAFACGGPGYRVMLERPPEDVADGEVLLEVIADHRSPHFTNTHRLTPVRIVRVIKGDIRETEAIIDFTSESSCEFFGSTGTKRFLVARANHGRNKRLYLTPVLYGERWNMISGVAHFEGMERE
jgi:hypothetical protein